MLIKETILLSFFFADETFIFSQSQMYK